MAGTSRAGVSLFPHLPGQGYQHDRGVAHERVPHDSGRTVNNAQNTTQASINLRPDRPQDHDPHPAVQGLHRRSFLVFCLAFCAPRLPGTLPEGFGILARLPGVSEGESPRRSRNLTNFRRRRAYYCSPTAFPEQLRVFPAGGNHVAGTQQRGIAVAHLQL